MPFLVNTMIVFPFFLLMAGRNFTQLWKGGLIGVGIMLVADTIGHFLNLYHYQNGFFMLGGFMPVLHIFSMFVFSMLYLNWLPRSWVKRIFYTVYVSAIFLAIEAIMFQAGALVYPNWELWYSYFLNIAGLSLLAYLSDFVEQRLHPA